ncbi:LysR family transcriptional regulator [Litoribrevibacter albus]|uniref:LysR family transcriptional regulator n=1 Tax=Litoribrevibacter albus TaxID=1473156 RepID=A0AA37S9K8_9GAMM|nr:LysR family transcriptional regulator [Litoribrevibacter albus]GLQ31882.1 LysR family transcriptional regulator [Litoribrevibacter albus]
MNVGRIDLNLLVHLDVLLREKNVTKAAEQLGITQPAMSNGLKRLRELFQDPLLIRTSEGMTATERAKELQPQIREILSRVDQAVQPIVDFQEADSNRVFRIMASDYAESTLMPEMLKEVRQKAPNITLDVLTPSDVSFADVEQGRVDMAINRFDHLPQSFHQKTVWTDSFSCIMSPENPIIEDFNLESYLSAKHIWVSKTGVGVGVGVNPRQVQKLGWVDEALAKIEKKRNISVFTRHYQIAILLAQDNDLIATLPTRAVGLNSKLEKLVIKEPPFEIPSFELKMAWSPLLHSNPAHIWMRNLITKVAERVMEDRGEEN